MPRSEMKSIAAAMRGSESSLYRWLRDNRVEFEAALRENATQGRPFWTRLATTFGEMGLRDTRGKPATPVNTRQIWQTVRYRWKAGHYNKKLDTPPPVVDEAMITLLQNPEFQLAAAEVMKRQISSPFARKNSEAWDNWMDERLPPQQDEALPSEMQLVRAALRKPTDGDAE